MKIESINTHHYLQSFKHQHKKRCLKIQNPKEAYLEKVGIYPPYSTIIANFDTKRYLKAIHLLKNGVDFTCLEEITSLDKKGYKQAITLVKEGLFDNFIYEIAQLDSIGFSRALDYRKQGLNNNCLKLFSELNSEETETAIRLIQEHELAPIIAGNLSKLGTEQRKVAIDFLDLTEIGIACKIANLEQDKQQKCRRYLEQGVNQNNLIEIAELDK